MPNSLPPLQPWIVVNFGVNAIALRDLGLRDASDRQIFEAAKKAGVAVMTKDGDFVRLLDEEGPPPQVIWITCGNTSNARLKIILASTLTKTIELLGADERLVEINAG